MEKPEGNTFKNMNFTIRRLSLDSVIIDASKWTSMYRETRNQLYKHTKRKPKTHNYSSQNQIGIEQRRKHLKSKTP